MATELDPFVRQVLAALAGHVGQDVLVIAEGPAPRVLVIDPSGRRSLSG